MPIDFTAPDLLPRHLTKADIENPAAFLASLFDFAHLPELRSMLREWFNCTITGSWHQLSVQERQDMVTFVEKMEQLLELAHLLHWECPASQSKEPG